MTFTATHSLFIYTNYLPIMEDVDHLTWRRLFPLRFPYRFRKRYETIDGPDDPRRAIRTPSGQVVMDNALYEFVIVGSAPHILINATRSLEFERRRILLTVCKKVASANSIHTSTSWRVGTPHRYMAVQVAVPGAYGLRTLLAVSSTSNDAG